jgi:hypothetical protein
MGYLCNVHLTTQTYIPARQRGRSSDASGAQTAPIITTPKVSRDQNFRTLVRARDGICRVSGIRAYGRDPPTVRGPNYAGLEAAHIFPFASCDQVSACLYILSLLNCLPIYFAKPIHRNLFLQCFSLEQHDRVHSLADSPQNGLLLRADIHALFDDYQWSFDVPLVSPNFLLFSYPTRFEMFV